MQYDAVRRLSSSLSQKTNIPEKLICNFNWCSNINQNDLFYIYIILNRAYYKL